jgi:hypothetical protein
MPHIHIDYPTEIRPTIIQGQEWVDFTAVVGASSSLTGRTDHGRFTVSDGVVFVHVAVTLTSGGGGPWTIYLPVAGRGGNSGNPIGTFIGLANGNIYQGAAVQVNNNAAQFYAHSGIGPMGNNNPFLDAAIGHVWRAQLIYELG